MWSRSDSSIAASHQPAPPRLASFRIGGLARTCSLPHRRRDAPRHLFPATDKPRLPNSREGPGLLIQTGLTGAGLPSCRQTRSRRLHSVPRTDIRTGAVWTELTLGTVSSSKTDSTMGRPPTSGYCQTCRKRRVKCGKTAHSKHILRALLGGIHDACFPNRGLFP
jgi:hypothetical protein